MRASQRGWRTTRRVKYPVLPNPKRQAAATYPETLGVGLSGSLCKHAVATMGSYAYGRRCVGRDLDVIVLSDATPSLLADDRWLRTVRREARPLRHVDWCAIVERRLRMPCRPQCGHARARR